MISKAQLSTFSFNYEHRIYEHFLINNEKENIKFQDSLDLFLTVHQNIF